MELTKAIFDWGTFWIGQDKTPHLHSVLGPELKIAVEKTGVTVLPNLL